MAYPRQGYSVPIAALDEYDHPTAGVFRVREKDVGTKMHVSCMLLNIPYLGMQHTSNTTLYGLQHAHHITLFSTIYLAALPLAMLCF